MRTDLCLAAWRVLAYLVWPLVIAGDSKAIAGDSADQKSRQFIQRHDKNGDGKLSRQEFPPQFRSLFDRIDVNRDGLLDQREDAVFRRNQKSRIQQRTRVPAAKIPAGFQRIADIEYVRGGGKSQRLDIYVPDESEKPRPLVVWIHGGAWRAGDKRRCPAVRLLTKGFVVASLNYRLSQEAIFPAQIEDCKAAIRWLRKNAAKYHIDPARFGVWGSSAGGHLVALLGTSGEVKQLEGQTGGMNVSSRVQAVCDFFGPTDFLQMDTHALPGGSQKHDPPTSPESKLVGGAIQENKERVARANPITYVSQDDPPFLIVHGDKDPLVPLHQSQLLADALKAANVACHFHIVRGSGHGFHGHPEVDGMVDAFFVKQLARTPE
ncbi:MAG: alpha/beta hydrolase fold domain-containing protein [Pirellulales bacterium]